MIWTTTGWEVRPGQVWRRKAGRTGIVTDVDEDTKTVRLAPVRRRHIGGGEVVWQEDDGKPMVTTVRELDKCELLHDPAD